MISFSSNDAREFSVMLTPGNYTIIHDKSAPIISADSQVKEIAVNRIGISRMELYFDTGIRQIPFFWTNDCSNDQF